jgi:hypothetical protein
MRAIEFWVTFVLGYSTKKFNKIKTKKKLKITPGPMSLVTLVSCKQSHVLKQFMSLKFWHAQMEIRHGFSSQKQL